MDIVLPILPLLPLVVFLLRKDHSERSFVLTATIVALLGLGFATYLTVKWYLGEVPQCSAGGCSTVQSSQYADQFFGIPTSVVGMVGYVLILLSLLIGGANGKIISAGLAFTGFLASVYFTVISLFVLQAVCLWCLASAVAMTILALLLVWRALRES